MKTIIVRLLLAIGLCAGCAACGSASPSASVTVLIPWDKNTDPGEYYAFKAVTDKFTQMTRIKVIPQSSRAESQQLDADLAAGDPPDVVDLSSPGAVDQYRGKGLQPLQLSLQGFAEPWRSLAMLGTATVYSIPVKVDVQSLIWYPTTVVKNPPASLADLHDIAQQGGTPWCLGLASGAASGWPGAKWIEDIFMAHYGPSAYEDWVSGRLSWDSGQVTTAWRTWGTLIRGGSAVSGGASGALATPFNQPMNRSHCTLKHGALIATGLTSTAGYSFRRFPSATGAPPPLIVSGDFMGLFTKNADAGKLLAYLATPQAQDIWVHQAYGDAFSASKKVSASDYPPGAQQAIASLLQPDIAKCFAADDLMRPDMSGAFSQAVLDYVNNPRTLPTLLKGLQHTQKGAGASPVPDYACSASGRR
jgi:alpha-glucoside transport system substrate-binding protein